MTQNSVLEIYWDAEHVKPTAPAVKAAKKNAAPGREANGPPRKKKAMYPVIPENMMTGAVQLLVWLFTATAALLTMRITARS